MPFLLSRPLLGLLHRSGEAMSRCVPHRVRRTVIVNAPFWFGAAWGGINRALPQSVCDKTVILTKARAHVA